MHPTLRHLLRKAAHVRDKATTNTKGHKQYSGASPQPIKKAETQCLGARPSPIKKGQKTILRGKATANKKGKNTMLRGKATANTKCKNTMLGRHQPERAQGRASVLGGQALGGKGKRGLQEIESRLSASLVGQTIAINLPAGDGFRSPVRTCSAAASSPQPSRSRSVRSSSKIDPTISPHCAVPTPPPCFFVHGSPPHRYTAIAVACARRKYQSHGWRVARGGVA
eukprot:scaffold24322_cov112-Isochrysis_galbana.AAC.1